MTLRRACVCAELLKAARSPWRMAVRWKPAAAAAPAPARIASSLSPHEHQHVVARRLLRGHAAEAPRPRGVAAAQRRLQLHMSRRAL